MKTLRKHKAEVIASEIVKGGTISEGMRRAGYSESTIHKGLTPSLRKETEDILSVYRDSQAKQVLDRLDKMSKVGDSAVERLVQDRGSRMDIEKAKLSFTVLKDLADRIGLTQKVNRSITAKVEYTDNDKAELDWIKERIAYLKSQDTQSGSVDEKAGNEL